jgi:Cytochrome C'
MTRRLRGWRVFPVCLAASLAVAGCGESEGEDQNDQSPPGTAGGMRGKSGPAPPGIKQIMGKVAKGPNSLTPVIGKELDLDPPPWESIQAQTKDYAQSASNLGKYDPPKGSKESWTKLTAAFAESAAELDRAAMAKNKETAKVAHDQLKNSCNACHQEHRGMGRAG